MLRIALGTGSRKLVWIQFGSLTVVWYEGEYQVARHEDEFGALLAFEWMTREGV